LLEHIETENLYALFLWAGPCGRTKNRTNVCKSIEMGKIICYDKTNKCSDLE
jgi:hypothetical protein